MRKLSRKWRIYFSLLAFVTVEGIFSRPAEATIIRTQQGLELGWTFYTGMAGATFVPADSGRIALATCWDFSDYFSIVGRFPIEVFDMPEVTNFGSANASYVGFGAGYSTSLRFRIGSDGFVPYFEFGPAAALECAFLQGAGGAVPATELALKFGINAGLGFDWFKGDYSGMAGFGLGITYFLNAAGPSFLDFPAGPQSSSGIRIDLRWNIGL